MYGHLRAICFFTFAVTFTVGLNCSVEDCEEKAACPPDSELKADGWGCVCVPERCPQTPACHFRSKRILRHAAEGIPGDCCDVYDCVFPSEINCTGVVCQETEVDCPIDSYRLPKSQGEGECCSKPLGCACLPAPCPPPLCPQGQRHIVIRPGNGKPGSCCPFYQCQSHENKTCMHNGKEVATGSKWKKKCVECTCIDGQVHCSQSVTCPVLPMDCPATKIPPNQCCPVCVFNHNIMDIAPRILKPDGCKSAKGIIYQNGASWQEDDCTHCTCADGKRKCQAEMCLQTCANATYVPGECCPRCNVTDVTVIAKSCPPLHCPLACKHGYVKDESECHICKCIEGEECHLDCKSGFLKDSNGMNICECANECPLLADCNKKCKHGYKTNKAGCEICKCEHCKPLIYCTKKCPHGYQINQKGCQICKCKEREPVNRIAEGGSITEKDCVTDQGIRRDNGESWFENCRQCYCFEGKEMCSLVSCPRVDCPDPVIAKNTCCPVCPAGNETVSGSEVLCYGPGGIKHEIETWKQGCLECLCHNGSVLCYSEPCPPVLCQHPLEGDCCPVCPEGSVLPLPVLDDTQSCGDKESGAKWRQSECTSCICINGEASCYTQSCDQIDTSCKTSVLLKKQCCPVCFDNMSDEKVCQVGNVTFNVGDEWEPEKCTRCSCGPSHTISCTQTICERPCTKNDNPCCPKCTEVDGGYGWFHGPIYLIILCILMFGVGAGSVVLWKHCMLKRHQLKICQATTPSYHYKYVPTYDQPAPSPHKSPV